MADLEAFDWSNPHRSEQILEGTGFCIGRIVHGRYTDF